ncbi:GAF and ANTAR domain-containing protein [Arthrobacter sp. TMN-50]
MTDIPRLESDVHNVLLDMVMDSDDVNTFLTGLTQLAATTLTSKAAGEVLCGLTLLRPRTMATVASSSELARKTDEIQYAFDDGPCLRAARENITVHVQNIPTDARFPDYRDAVAEHGIRSALGIPVPLGGDARAGLDFYSTVSHAFDDGAVAAAEAFALEASKSLRLAVRMAQLSDASKHLEAAMQSRTVIDLAAGIIMAQNRCSQGEAVKILKAASSARNIKLRDVASAVVASANQAPTATHFDR